MSGINKPGYHKSHYLKNKEFILNKSREWYRKNREKKLAIGKAYRRTEHGRAVCLSSKFKITYDKAVALLKITHCEICGNDFAVATDHDHTTGKIRGRLCYRCNRAMGAFGDSTTILLKAIRYLKERKEGFFINS